MFLFAFIKELLSFDSSIDAFLFLSGFKILTFGLACSRLLNLSVVERNILFALVLSFSPAVKALVEAVDLPSSARSNFYLFALLTLTSSPVYWPGS